MRAILFSAGAALFIGMSTLASGADEECNRIILTKRADAVALNNCDIALFKGQIASMTPSKRLAELMASNGEPTPLSLYNDKLGFFRANIKNRQDINQAVSESVVTRQEAMEIRSTLMEREGKYFASMEERKQKYMLSLEKVSVSQPARQPIVIQQAAATAPPVATPQPTSMVCQNRDIFGEVKCEFK